MRQNVTICYLCEILCFLGRGWKLAKRTPSPPENKKRGPRGLFFYLPDGCVGREPAGSTNSRSELGRRRRPAGARVGRGRSESIPPSPPTKQKGPLRPFLFFWPSVVEDYEPCSTDAAA